MDTIYVLSDRLRHVLNALERVEETHVELLVGNDWPLEQELDMRQSCLRWVSWMPTWFPTYLSPPSGCQIGNW